MRLALTFTLVILAALTGYLFLPRTASLANFDAERISDLNASLSRHRGAGKDMQALLDLYGVLNGQYGMAPIPSASASLAMLQAQRAFAEAADQPDEEKALPFLEEYYSIIAKQTASPVDPAIIARLELVTWSLARDRSKERQLADALSEKLALLHGGSAKDFQAVSADFARAMRLAAGKNGQASREAAAFAWKKLRHLLDTRQVSS